MSQSLAPADHPVVRRDTRVLNAMTVDVEDYYHAHALERAFPRDTWPRLERRVGYKTRELLDLFDAHQTRGTFFTLGSIAREDPPLIREIVARGHELASHGLDHHRASDQDRAGFSADVTAAKRALEDAGGVAVAGYRAASFSIGPRNWWAFDVLEEAGYRYSSSVSAGRLGGAGMETPATPFRPGSGALVEFPISAISVLRRSLPTGGGYFRLLPYALFRRALARAEASAGRPAIFYVHPWEIDPRQPRAAVTPLTRARHTVNLKRTKAKLDRALSDFCWAPMREVFAETCG